MLQTLGLFVLGYFVVIVTTLSVSAVSTNGQIKGGGAYYMISRVLGPEFGGAIGVIFYAANVTAAGVFILGLVEALVAVDIFGYSLPTGYFWNLLYGTIALFFCLFVSFVGASTRKFLLCL